MATKSFDPDAYLKKKGFDPDAYLGSKTGVTAVQDKAPTMSSRFAGVQELEVAPVRPVQAIKAAPKQPLFGGAQEYLDASIEGSKQALRDVRGPYEGTLAEKGSSALMRGLGAVGYPAMSYAMAPFVVGGSVINRAAGGVPGKILSRALEPLNLRGLGLGEEVKKIPVVGENIYSKLLHPKTESEQADVRAVKNVAGALLMPGTKEVLTTAVKTPGYALSGAGKIVEKVGKGGTLPITGKKFGLERVAENIVKTGDKKAIEEISSSLSPGERTAAVSGVLQKYGLTSLGNSPDKSISKALEMAYARARKADEFLINKAKAGTEIVPPLGISYDIVKPLEEVEKGVLEHINTKIPAGNRVQAMRQFAKIKQELSDKYGKGVPITMLPEFKNELGVNWSKGSAIEEITESLKNQIRKKMYHEINDKIASISPETRALNSEAKELFDVAEAMSKVKPLKGSLKPTLVGAGAGASLGAGKNILAMAPQILQGNIPQVSLSEMAAPAVAGGALVGGLQYLTRPQVLSKGVGLGQKMQDIGTLMAGETPTLRRGSKAYEKQLSMTPEDVESVRNKIAVDKFWEDIARKIRAKKSEPSAKRSPTTLGELAPKSEGVPKTKKVAPKEAPPVGKVSEEEYQNLKETMPELMPGVPKSPKEAFEEKLKKSLENMRSDIETRDALSGSRVPQYERQVELVEKVKSGIEKMSDEELEELVKIDISNQSPPYAGTGYGEMSKPMVPYLMPAKKMAFEELSKRIARSKRKFLY